MHELEERYGNDHVIATALVKRALDWPIILNDKPKALDNFTIFLAECNNAVNAIEAVRVLECPDNIKKLVSKLPLHLHDKWRNLVQRTRDHHQPIKFHLLAACVREEAKKVNDPVRWKEALSSEFKQSPSPKPRANAGQGLMRARGINLLVSQLQRQVLLLTSLKRSQYRTTKVKRGEVIIKCTEEVEVISHIFIAVTCPII